MSAQSQAGVRASDLSPVPGRATPGEADGSWTSSVQVTGHHRKHAIRLLNGPAPGAARPPRRRAACRIAPPSSRRCGRSGRPRAIPGPCGSRPCCRCGCRGRAAGCGCARPWSAQLLAHQPAADRSPAGARTAASSASGCTGGPSRARCSSTTSPSRRIAGTSTVPGFTEIDLVAHCGSLGDGRVRALAQPDRHPHHLGGDGRRPGQEPGRGADGARGAPPGAALPPAGHRLRQRLGVHQPASLGLLPGPGDPVHPRAGPTRRTTTPTSSRRTGPTSASCWATCATTPRRRRPRSTPSTAASCGCSRTSSCPRSSSSARSGSARASAAATMRPADAARPRARLRRRSAAAVAAQLQRQRDRLDPFALARTIEQQLERIYALANRAPPAAPSAPAAPRRRPRRVRKRLSINPSPPSARPPRPVTSKTAR